MVVLVYVDGLLIIGDDPLLIQETKANLQQSFKITDLGALKYFLGIKFARGNDGILMHQRKYALELISDLGLSRAKPIGAPFKLNQRLTTIEFDFHFGAHDDPPLDDPGPYQRLLGRLLYLTITMLDIEFDVQCLSQFMHSPKYSHLEAALRLVRYVKQAPGQRILMSSTFEFHLHAYCDADWVVFPNTRHSITDYCKVWKFISVLEIQKIVHYFQSFIAVEFRSLASTVTEIVWLVWLFKELVVDIQ
uniref:Uncharacterized mitochondrial protein AtMg00810-like n=1 Tax=Nicotiana tabacum TaxID=4097 RepID=A0A1S4AC39_TOBAC